jgi:hypothetical protein
MRYLAYLVLRINKFSYAEMVGGCQTAWVHAELYKDMEIHQN